MSYCRFSDGSDVYMLPTVRGIECCSCHLSPDGKGWYRSILLKNPEEALKHLREHIYAGHKVPKYATDRLKEEIKNE